MPSMTSKASPPSGSVTGLASRRFGSIRRKPASSSSFLRSARDQGSRRSGQRRNDGSSMITCRASKPDARRIAVPVESESTNRSHARPLYVVGRGEAFGWRRETTPSLPSPRRRRSCKVPAQQRADAERCPVSRTKGKPVELLTIEALLIETALGRLDTVAHRFRPDASCDVVYFDTEGFTPCTAHRTRSSDSRRTWT